MKTVRVNASSKYEVIIGEGLLRRVGDAVSSVLCGEKVALVCDSNVEPLYADPVESSLKSVGYCVSRFVFPAGEESKCSKTYVALLEFLAVRRLSRNDGIVALGGGVTGDLAGFAAATYLRGIDFVQLPTTLLAAVDSSVGGKTGIDLEAGKNLCGAFHQPKLVLCDIDTMRTLDSATFACGMAEVIKYGVIRDAELFGLLERSSEKLSAIPAGNGDGEAMALLEDVIASCVSIKRDVVEADEFEGGLRRILNFGHTAAHSIEKLSFFRVPHGAAVAAGMAVAAGYACKTGDFKKTDDERIKALLRRYQLPSSVAGCAAMYGADSADFSAEAMAEAALSDKKRSGGNISLILPDSIGSCVIKSVETGRLTEFFAES